MNTNESQQAVVEQEAPARVRSVHTHWSRLGIDISACKSVDEAIASSSLNWQVGLSDVYIPGTNDVDGIKVIGKQVTGVQAVQRLDTGDVIGSVGRGYQPLQNHEMFGVFDGIVESGKAVFDKAGALSANRYPAGSRVFFSARLDRSLDIGNDSIISYIYGKSGHDGGQSLSFSILSYVLICSNGMMGLRNTNTISIRHTKNAHDKIEKAREVLGFAEQHQIWLDTMCHQLFSAPMNVDGMVSFVEELLPPTKDAKGNPRVSSNLKNKREKLVSLFSNGTGQQDRGNSRWRAFNAVTEFIDHTVKHSSKLKDDATARHDSCLEGGGSALKERALELLTA